ncbi:hypothetical protein [Salinivibrio kushneri]|uniref:hypothetical protein n=1 Tax=Salinivibrio kushneri TaxID=1908198 RepID=UPI0022B3C0F9|nr:hypothetical protein [Salinivibrio kushneri]WBA17018.1 hypothetical protein O4598_07540 [Salinivibrio kushneri]
MAGFFKKLFGGDNDAEDILQGMMDRSEKWQVMGAEIAQDCYQNGLLQGEIVRLSDIVNFIKKNHSYNGNIVENGFLNQMKSYLDQGVVASINAEGGDIVFVHQDHIKDVLKG